MACIPTKPVAPDITAVIDSYGPFLSLHLDTLASQYPDTSSMDSLRLVNDSLLAIYYNTEFDTAFVEYQSRDSLIFYFYVQMGGQAKHFNLNATSFDSSTIEMGLSYQDNVIDPYCKCKFEVSLYSFKDNLLNVKFLRFNKEFFIGVKIPVGNKVGEDVIVPLIIQ
jgi:hypothetical protein